MTATRRNVPYDPDDEAVLLGAALLTQEAAELVATKTTPADFYVGLHQRVSRAITNLVTAGLPVDVATVASDLSRSNGVADLAAAKKELLNLQASCPASTNAPAYLRSVREWTRRRRALTLAHELQTHAKEGLPIEGIVAQIEGLAAEEKLDTTTWQEIPLMAVLEGGTVEDEPSMLVREDGACLLYPGKIHVFAGEPESGKSWLALHACDEQMGCGRHVVFVDFEDSLEGVVSRLLTLGVTAETILARFHYIRPSEPLGPEGRHALASLITRTQPALVVVDGLTEALTLHGLALESNRDVAEFLEILPRFVARQGPAVVIIDHVEKDKERRGRWAIGAQHKLAGVDGVSYGLEVVKPVVRDGEGLVRLVVAKDRPGHVRRVAAERKTAAEITTISEKNLLTVTITTPGGRGSDWRPTGLMERLSMWLERNPGSNVRLIEASVTGKGPSIREALKFLVVDGHAVIQPGPRGAHHYRICKPYREHPE
ncbi:MAG: DnaB-like helicase N-terminal domain-containing protein [Nocardioidaceae bacterium]